LNKRKLTIDYEGSKDLYILYFVKAQAHSEETLDWFFLLVYGRKHAKCIVRFTQGGNGIY